MGRSQVLRNRTHGRPGQGRGRGRGGGGGGSGRGGGSSRPSKRPDPRTLGDNAFRYEKNKGSNDDDNDEGEHYDGLLDDINFLSSSGGEYFGPSHDGTKADEDDGDLLGKSNGEDGSEWMSVDISMLAKSLSQIPIHERLKVPRHIGQHLRNMYGEMGLRKKTLAELREESKCVHNIAPPLAKTEMLPESKGGNDIMPNGGARLGEENAAELAANEDKVNEAGDDDNEEDLEAWLDDMIS